MTKIATGQFATFLILANSRLSLWSIYDFHFGRTQTMFILIAVPQDERGKQGIHTFLIRVGINQGINIPVPVINHIPWQSGG